ncbi:MAG: alpha/beta fold hydrolase, partial [Dehalococcoidia bacterium]
MSLSNGSSTTTLVGQVTDANGNGVPAATVNLNATAGSLPATVTTAADGSFRATYTAPTSPGSVTINASLTGTTLVASTTITVTSGRLPVVLVHGINFMGNPLTSCHQISPEPSSPGGNSSYFSHLPVDLQHAGYQVFYAHLSSAPCWTPKFEDNVPNLMQVIDAAKQATQQDKVILIAHSMGGLVSRAYIEGSCYRKDVQALYTLGSPHQGIPESYLATLIGATTTPVGVFAYSTYCATYQPGLCEINRSIMGSVGTKGTF